MRRFLIFFVIFSIFISVILVSCSEAGYSSTQSYMEKKTKNIEKKDVEGYTEEERKVIFFELLDLERQAEEEAISEFPIDEADPNYSEENYDNYKELKRQLSRQYKAELAEKYGFTVDQIDAIRREGFQKDWTESDY